MSTLKVTRIPPELLAAFDETRGGMARYFKKRQSNRDAVAILLFVYDTVKREGRLADMLERYQSGPSGLDFR